MPRVPVVSNASTRGVRLHASHPVTAAAVPHDHDRLHLGFAPLQTGRLRLCMSVTDKFSKVITIIPGKPTNKGRDWRTVSLDASSLQTGAGLRPYCQTKTESLLVRSGKESSNDETWRSCTQLCGTLRRTEAQSARTRRSRLLYVSI